MSDATPEILHLDYAEVLATIPHRHPFLFVDAVPELELGKRIKAIKNVSFGDDFFLGHFPSDPVMPGVLQIEALAQAACILIAKSYPKESEGKRPAFAAIEDVRFRRPVRPGHQLELHADLVQFRRGFATVNARAIVDGEIVAEAVIKATLV
jgi:3-hydroxyacyl-[acyl-carrier-protein] dehydratase